MCAISILTLMLLLRFDGSAVRNRLLHAKFDYIWLVSCGFDYFLRQSDAPKTSDPGTGRKRGLRDSVDRNHPLTLIGTHPSKQCRSESPRSSTGRLKSMLHKGSSVQNRLSRSRND